MAQRPPSTRIAASEDATDRMGVLHSIIESQQQTALLCDGLMAAQQTAMVAMERSTAL